MYMKKVIVVFYLFLLSFSFVYSQSEEDSTCKSNIETIFKVHDLKIRYEAVQYMYSVREKKGKYRLLKSNSFLNSTFELIRGFPMEGY